MKQRYPTTIDQVIPQRLTWLLDADQIPGRLGRRFARHGYLLYLVGGTVRDAFMAREHPSIGGEFDFATNARPEAIKAILTGWAEKVYTTGEIYGTVAGIKSGHSVEVTTFRRDVYRSDSRHPEVSFSDTIEEDLERRDFTVNALAIEVPQAEIVDPFGGLVDLGRRILRTPTNPERTFEDDPLRMLRLFRFWASLQFAPDKATLEAVKTMANRISIVSAERIRDELSKLLMATHPAEALLGLVRSGLADQFLPELSSLHMAQDPQHRHKDVFAHSLAVVEKASPRLVLRLACLLHDIGKPDTRRYGPKGVSFHHHEVVGARMARRRLEELRYPKAVIDDVSRLVELHLRPHTLKMGWTDSAVRRYVRDAGPLLEDLNELVRCDVTTVNRRRARAIQSRIDQLEQRISELKEQEDLDRLRPPVNGHQVMAYLGIPPGPEVGEIMTILLERRIEEGPYPPVEALETARQWNIGKGRDDPGPPPAV
ncbi:MAG: CCA tRNA nucleotidyltransferase [Actinomycetia bacterium]|nr:CCA tRNA nucleotidyltransferase [Actinomycetes bacterium]